MTIKHSLILILTLIFSLASTNFAQFNHNDDRVLARVGDETITVSEFKKRFELTPQIGSNIESRNDALKNQVLYTLIAEKLWAQEATGKGYDTTDVMKYTFNLIEKMYARDALYRNEVKSKVVITPEDIREGTQRNQYSLKLNYLYSENLAEIQRLYDALTTGASFDSILAKRPESANQVTPYVIGYGQAEKEVEDAVYGLTPGGFTTPLKSPSGWYIFKLIEKEERAFHTINEMESEQKKVRKAVEGTIENQHYREFFGKFFGDKKIETNGYMFWSFSDKVIDILGKRREAVKSNDKKATVIAEDYYTLADAFGPDTLNMTFIKLGDSPMTMKEFLHAFIFEGFYTSETNRDVMRGQLNGAVKKIIEYELLGREALKRGLQNDPEVAADIAMWKAHYLSTQLNKDFLEQSDVSENDVENYYEENRDNITLPAKVNIVEILTDSLEVVEKVLDELDNGADIRQLAREHTKRAWTKEKGGEFGFFPVSEHGEIGQVASAMKVGEVYGPLKLDDGYSVFKLIGREEAKKQGDVAFGEVKSDLTSKLRYEKFGNLKVKKTVELADKYDVNIDKDLFHSLKVTNFSMLVYKYFGFGGRSLAVPLSTPFTEWVEEWEKADTVLP